MIREKEMRDTEFRDNMYTLGRISEVNNYLEKAASGLAELQLYYIKELGGESAGKLSGKRVIKDFLAPTSNKRDKLLTTEEATKYLGISKPTYLKYITKDKTINAVRVGRGWKVFKSELDRFLKGDGRKY